MSKETDIKFPSNNKLPYARRTSIMKRLQNYLDGEMKAKKAAKEKKVDANG